MARDRDAAPAGEARRGDWMQTFTGRQFWPLDPRPEEVAVEDIAHALSQQCRYAGHTRVFYSVAEHSVWCSRLVPPRHALAALLHDAAEAYLVDLPRPVKRNVPGYAGLEAVVEAVIFAAMGVEWDDEARRIVKLADNTLLRFEREQLMAPPPRPWASYPEIPDAPDILLQGWWPDQAETAFLARHAELRGARHG